VLPGGGLRQRRQGRIICPNAVAPETAYQLLAATTPSTMIALA
jgi:hypothetical protein